MFCLPKTAWPPTLKMQKRWKIGIVVLAGVLALSTGIGIALAKSANSNSSIQAGYYADGDGSQFAGETVNQWYCGGRGLMAGYLTPQLATLLGTTTADLQTQLNSGKTLSDIANAKGVSQEQLIQTMMGPYADHLATMVKYGYLTQAQADAMTQQAKTRLQAVVTSQFNANNGFLGMGGMMRGWFSRSPRSGDATPGANTNGKGIGGCGGPGYGPGTNGSGAAAGASPASGRGMMGRW